MPHGMRDIAGGLYDTFCDNDDDAAKITRLVARLCIFHTGKDRVLIRLYGGCLFVCVYICLCVVSSIAAYHSLGYYVNSIDSAKTHGVYI